jgi:hypothetical protein
MVSGSVRTFFCRHVPLVRRENISPNRGGTSQFRGIETYSGPPRIGGGTGKAIQQ